MKQVFKDSWAENFKFLPMFILWFGGYRWLNIERGRGSTGKELKTIVLHNVLIGITVWFYVSKMPCDWLNFSGFGWRFWMDLIHSVGEGNLENMTTVWPVSWTGAIRGFSPASPMLGMYPLLMVPTVGVIFKDAVFERTMCCWHYLDGICAWTPLRPLYKLLIFWWMGVVIY